MFTCNRTKAFSDRINLEGWSECSVSIVPMSECFNQEAKEDPLTCAVVKYVLSASRTMQTNWYYYTNSLFIFLGIDHVIFFFVLNYRLFIVLSNSHPLLRGSTEVASTKWKKGFVIFKRSPGAENCQIRQNRIYSFESSTNSFLPCHRTPWPINDKDWK